MNIKKIIKNIKKYNKTSTIKFVQENLKHYRKIILTIFIIFYFLAMFLTGAANNFAKGKKLILIEKNMSAQQIIANLSDQGLLPGKLATKLYIKLLNKDNDLHSGYFVIADKANLTQIMKILSEEGLVKSYLKVTIPEGMSLSEIIQLLDEKMIIPTQEMQSYLNNLDYSTLRQKYPFLKDNKLNNSYFLEGYLFPDTYHFSQYSHPLVIIETMLNNFAEKTKEIDYQKHNLHEIITLASIVEKEAVKKEEQGIIAGIFIKRLEKSMTLGSCPTVKYALGKPHMKYLLYKHLEVDSAYNTYKYQGLPPGPICSPGKDAILAVLNPQESEYLYFLAKGDGSHQFSQTYQEHLRKQQQLDRIY